MIYDLRFLPNSEPSAVNFETGEINIYQFVIQDDGASIFREFLKSDFAPRICDEDRLIQDGGKLRDDSREYLASSIENSSYGLLNTIKDCFVFWVSTFWFLKDEQKVSWTAGLGNNYEIGRWAPGLFVRTGVVEMHVLKNFLLGDLTEDTIFELENSPPIPAIQGHKDNWLNDQHINLNVRDLMTNAGWYPDEEFSLSSLRDWYNKYSTAISKADGIFRVPGCDFYELFFEYATICESKSGFHYFNFPNYQEFYKMLAGHNVLFVTPFAKEIQSLYESGDIFKLWLDFELPDFSLTLIEAPMSIYPNRPAENWTSSFHQLAEKIRDSFSQHPHSLFFASSGCYGLPICDMVFQQFGIASVYQGNWTNFLFGIRQNTTESVEPDKRNLKLWRSSSLNKIEGVSAVDDGRYVLD